MSEVQKRLPVSGVNKSQALRQVRLSWFLLIACLLGPLLGYVGSYLRVICIEWRVADRLCRDGAYIESNSFDSLGLSFQRAPSEYATLVERMLSRPNRVTIRHRADAQLIGQVPAFRALKKFSIYDVDPSEFAALRCNSKPRPRGSSHSLLQA